jgi:hypothetical protein
MISGKKNCHRLNMKLQEKKELKNLSLVNTMIFLKKANTFALIVELIFLTRHQNLNLDVAGQVSVMLQIKNQ